MSTTYDRVYSLAIGVAGDALDSNILGEFERSIDGVHDVVFGVTLGMCDEDPVLTRIAAPVTSRIADEAINDYLQNNPPDLAA